MLKDYDKRQLERVELCRRYGICRDTFYEWRERRATGAPDWFADRSHAPAFLSARDASGAEGKDYFAAATISVSGAAQSWW